MPVFSLPPQRVIFGLFAAYSFSIGTLFGRLADLQLALAISPSVLGMVLAGIALGVQVSLLISGRVLQDFGFKPVMLISIAAIGLLVCLAGLAALAAAPLPVFALALFGTGLAIGLAEVAVNMEADRIEQALGRRIMNRSHAFWSFGFFLAGLVGAAMAQLAIVPAVHFALMLIPAVGASALLMQGYQPAAARPQDALPAPRLVRPTRSILLLVAVTLSAMLLEGAGIDWSVIFMRDMFATPPFISGMALALGALTQFLVRYFADAFVDSQGVRKVARLSIACLLAGVLLVSLSTTPLMALAGFAMLGAGHAVIFPLAISAAASRTDRPAAVNVAALTQLSFLVFLLAPPMLGFVADYASIRLSFGLALPLVIVSWLASHALVPHGQSDK